MHFLASSKKSILGHVKVHTRHTHWFGNRIKWSYFDLCLKLRHFLFNIVRPGSSFNWFFILVFLSGSIQFGRDFRDRIGVTISLFPEGGSFQGSPIHSFFLLFSLLLQLQCSRVFVVWSGAFFPLAFTSVYFPLRWPLLLFSWHF